ncbi:excisionase [Bariatricus sp. SGI.154]|uniref:excisionase n=1 Tax=Bariatricus sp. SGI.154 TaxID=3420549 RepID=UPI003D07D9EC
MKKPSAEQKDILNQEEAIVYFGLSRRKFYKLLKEGKNTPFMAMYGSRRLIIRTEFEKYLEKHPELRRRT